MHKKKVSLRHRGNLDASLDLDQTLADVIEALVTVLVRSAKRKCAHDIRAFLRDLQVGFPGEQQRQRGCRPSDGSSAIPPVLDSRNACAEAQSEPGYRFKHLDLLFLVIVSSLVDLLLSDIAVL